MEDMLKFNRAIDEMLVNTKSSKRNKAVVKAQAAKENFRQIVELDIDTPLLEMKNYPKYSSLPSQITSEIEAIRHIYFHSIDAMVTELAINKENNQKHPELFLDTVANRTEIILQNAKMVKPRVDAVYRSFRNECRTTRNEYRTTPSMSKNDDECLLI